MDKSKIENAINHITSLQEKLCYCENNLQYIKRLQALKYWLHKFDSNLSNMNWQVNGQDELIQSIDLFILCIMI